MLNRFSRQELVKDFGSSSQKKLSQSKVLVIGAGGLGCPVLLYLAAAGIGTIGVIDGDCVTLSNLNRQILFGMPDVGLNKATQAVQKLESSYPDLTFNSYPYFLTKENIFNLFEEYDCIVDGSDNFSTRFLVNDACVILRKPLIFGAIYASEGQVAVFGNQGNSAQYRDLHPEIPDSNQIPNCQETGVIGVLPGIIGCMQASETIKLISGFGNPLHNKLIHYSLKNSSMYEMDIQIRKDKAFPKTKEEVLQTEYELKCNIIPELSWSDAIDLIEQENSEIWDIREQSEMPEISLKNVVKNR